MVQTLARNNKFIAWMLTALFYLQLVLSPIIAQAEPINIRPNYSFSYRHVPNVLKPTGNKLLIPSEGAGNPASPTDDASRKPENKETRNNTDQSFTTGPTQPEMNSFQSVNANNMVDLFSGDFSYNIPLLDVGGYPVNLHYQSGITMDQEASWVGLGWNINPGVISRNMRGLPDDFSGGEDQVSKTTSMKPNKTFGVTGGGDIEIVGFPVDFRVSLGVFHNNYKGWGTELGLNASINAGVGGKGALTGQLGITNNSQSGLDISPSIGFKMAMEESKTMGGVTIGSNFNSRMGIQELQVTGEVKQTLNSEKKTRYSIGTSLNAGISFSKPSFTPTIRVPFTSTQKAVTIKLGGEVWGIHPSGYIRGYVSDQQIEEGDKVQTLPAFGYLNYEAAGSNSHVLLDFNREKDVVYTNNSPHIALPMYTYDTWSISGEGTGGMFRPYRSDIGAVYDHSMTSKSGSQRLAVDIGFGGIAHGGIDFSDAYSITSTNAWISANSMYDVTRFRSKDTTFEPAYFKNPGEKTAVNKSFLHAIGDDSLVRVMLTPTGDEQNDPDASATRSLALFKNGRKTGTRLFNANVLRKERDKRTQMISYLTADEARTAGLDKSIKSFPVNIFPNGSCAGFNAYDRVYAYEGRQKNHISEITVLNGDGRRYVYGIPVYNTKQVDVTMSVNVGDNNTGLVDYTSDQNSQSNKTGRDWYFNKEVLPPYTHSFLLSGILSPDYVDLSGDGITEDDQGDAVKFNYSRLSSKNDPYKWRAPFFENKAFYNEGLKTDNRDERGSFSYGEREVWLLNSIESKTMIATFVLDSLHYRKDGFGVKDENGGASASQKLRRLKEINLYAKADWLKSGTAAKPVKTVHFAYSYTLCTGAPGTADNSLGKLTLDSVWFTYNNKGRAVKNAYKFQYHATNPVYDSKMSDRWGNYKPSRENPGALSNADYSYTLQKGNGNWKQDSADKYIPSWTLSAIKLPSGGRIEVDYEADDYAYVQNKRAMQFFKLEGFGPDATTRYSLLHQSGAANIDYSYAFVRVTEPISTVSEIRQKYLEGVDKLFFKLMVSMPSDVANYGSGSEIIPCYAEFDEVYTVSGDPTLICLKLRPLTGNESPLATAAIQFLRQNLPHKAYPYSEPGDNLDVRSFLSMLATIADNMSNTLNGFSRDARKKNMCNKVSVDQSFVRLNNPNYRKFGGGLRVRKVQVFDNWNKMTQDKEAKYGQEYNYNTFIEVNGEQKEISSGVASYEPSLGNDENPFHVPFKLYSEQVGALAPRDFLYTEEPFAETFFPAPSVGYSKVTVQSIHKTRKSASGITQTEFYTTKDFPTLVEITPLDRESKKTYNPRITNFFRVDAKNYVTISQGFKVELNDMNGKMKSTISFSQNDLKNPISYTFNYYRLEQDNTGKKKLSNKVAVINSSNGVVDENAEMGKEVEIMMDIREQTSISGSASVEANTDFVHPFPPIVLGSAIPIPSKETNRFRSIAVLKVVNRYGILDSVVQIEKGSRVSTRNLVFDGETGEVLVTRTNNLFDDPIYNLNYPAHWAYSGMEAAYKNLGTVLYNLQLKRGILYKNNVRVDMDRFFESGDEILVRGQHKRSSNASDDPCAHNYYVFDSDRSDSIVWAINGEKGQEKEKGIYFIDKRGYPVSALVDWMKIVRSGKRNQMSTPVGSLTSMENPVRTVGTLKKLVIDNETKILNASAARFKDTWKVEKVLKQYDSCVMEPHYWSGYIPFQHVVHRRIFKTLFPTNEVTADWNSPYLVSGFQRENGTYYYTRTLMKLNMSFIPNDAVIEEAYFNLSARAPVMLYNNHPYWGTTFDYSYEGLEEQNIGYLIPSLMAFNIGSNPTWESDVSLNSILPRTILPHRNYLNNCVDYLGVNCKDIMQVLVGKDPSQQNLMLKMDNESNSNGSQEVRFMSFNGEIASEAKSGNTITPFASWECNQGGEFSGCRDRKCASTLFVKYKYGVKTCYKVCRQEYLQADTINPYVVGMAGNWRVDTSYAYYNKREQSSLATATNIRTDGLISNFKPYWLIGQKLLSADPDPSRWVWNSKSTLHNRKGLELENKDPLDRYNSAIYGYNKTLPIAIAQNSRNKEFTFDGFEDQQYQTDKCLECFESGWLKIDAENGRRTEQQSHTGRTSLEVYANKKIVYETQVTGNINSEGPLFSLKIDSVMKVDTVVVRNGTGMTGKFGVWRAIPSIINPCIGRTITSVEWWPQTYVQPLTLDYQFGAPPAFCANDYFAAQLTGELLVEHTDTYYFKVRVDDGYQMWFNGANHVFDIQSEGETIDESTMSFNLERGKAYPIFTELVDHTAQTYAYLQWKRNGNPNWEDIPLGLQYPSREAFDNSSSTRLDTTWCIGLKPASQSNGITEQFTPVKGKKMVVSGWVKEATLELPSYLNSSIIITYTGSTKTETLTPSGKIIDGWQRIDTVITIPEEATAIKYELVAGGNHSSFFDDLRIHPFNANMKSFSYDPVNIRLMAEMDENNYATFYEYDDEGTLIRVKKETERGVKTIRETRSALTKKENL